MLEPTWQAIPPCQFGTRSYCCSVTANLTRVDKELAGRLVCHTVRHCKLQHTHGAQACLVLDIDSAIASALTADLVQRRRGIQTTTLLPKAEHASLGVPGQPHPPQCTAAMFLDCPVSSREPRPLCCPSGSAHCRRVPAPQPASSRACHARSKQCQFWIIVRYLKKGNAALPCRLWAGKGCSYT